MHDALLTVKGLLIADRERVVKELESKMPTRDDTVTNTLLCMGERIGLCEAIEIIRGGQEE